MVFIHFVLHFKSTLGCQRGSRNNAVLEKLGETPSHWIFGRKQALSILNTGIYMNVVIKKATVLVAFQSLNQSAVKTALLDRSVRSHIASASYLL